MILIIYQRRAVAMAGPDRFYLAPHIDRRPDGDPLKRFVCFLALYARNVQPRALPGEPSRYVAAPAERYARAALIPAREFAALERCSDPELAAHFSVPVEQIANRRRDPVDRALTRARLGNPRAACSTERRISHRRPR